MWSSEDKLLCLYRATGKIGDLAPEIRGKVYAEKFFTIQIDLKEQRDGDFTNDAQISRDEVKSCSITFTLPSENGHFKNISTIEHIENAFQENNIPPEWIRMSSFPQETNIEVRWWPALTERQREWVVASNTLETFPRKAKDLFIRVVNVIHFLLVTPNRYRLTINSPPDTMLYRHFENPWAPPPHIASEFTSSGSVTLFYIPKNLRLIDKWSNNVGMNEDNEYVGHES